MSNPEYWRAFTIEEMFERYPPIMLRARIVAGEPVLELALHGLDVEREVREHAARSLTASVDAEMMYRWFRD